MIISIWEILYKLQSIGDIMASKRVNGPGRKKHSRVVGYRPRADFFKPRGIPMMDLEEVELTLEELEAIRLVDLLDMDHESAAEKMGISRRSLSNDLRSGRKKVADSLVNSKALMIGGGSFTISKSTDVKERIKGSGDGMKIAVPADGNTLDSRVDRRFARCPFFMIADTEKNETNFMENDAQNAGGGAGITASQKLIDLGVDCVISGNLGPRAHQTLEAAGIGLYMAEGVTVGEALEMFKEGKLKKIGGPNVAGHYGLG